MALRAWTALARTSRACGPQHSAAGAFSRGSTAPSLASVASLSTAYPRVAGPSKAELAVSAAGSVSSSSSAAAAAVGISSSLARESRRTFSASPASSDGAKPAEADSERAPAAAGAAAAAPAAAAESSGPGLLDWVSAEIGHAQELVKSINKPVRKAQRRLLQPGARAIALLDIEDTAQMTPEARAAAYTYSAKLARKQGLLEEAKALDGAAAALKGVSSEDAAAEAEAEASAAAGKKEKGDGEEGEEGAEGEEGSEKDAPETKVEYTGPRALMVTQQGTVWGRRLEAAKDALRGVLLRPVRTAQRRIAASENESVVQALEQVDRVRDQVADLREAYETSQHPLVWRLRDASDVLFRETTAAHAKGKLYAIDATFDLFTLREDVEEYMIPVVIKALLKGDIDTLKSACGDSALAGVVAHVRERTTKGHISHNKVLDVQHLTVEEPSIDQNVPVIKVNFSTQQIHMVKDKTGKIIEGGPSDIVNVYYAWTLRREFGNPDFDWRITRFGFHQVLALV